MSNIEEKKVKRKFIANIAAGSVGVLFGKFPVSSGQEEQKKKIISIHPSAVKREIKG